MTDDLGPLFERAMQAAAHDSMTTRLGEATMREVNRAFDRCLASGIPFTAEHVFRECSPEVRLLLDLAQNRNVLGAVFRQRSKAKAIAPSGRLVPACHARSKGRLLAEWRAA